MRRRSWAGLTSVLGSVSAGRRQSRLSVGSAPTARMCGAGVALPAPAPALATARSPTATAPKGQRRRRACRALPCGARGGSGARRIDGQPAVASPPAARHNRAAESHLVASRPPNRSSLPPHGSEQRFGAGGAASLTSKPDMSRERPASPSRLGRSQPLVRRRCAVRPTRPRPLQGQRRRRARVTCGGRGSSGARLIEGERAVAPAPAARDAGAPVNRGVESHLHAPRPPNRYSLPPHGSEERFGAGGAASLTSHPDMSCERPASRPGPGARNPDPPRNRSDHAAAAIGTHRRPKPQPANPSR
jgi:hypothetical protein